MATKPPRTTSKFQEACDGLTRLARQSGPGAKLPTVVQLREQLGVGVNTLSDALAELEARDVLMRRQGSGIFVSERLVRTVALLCDPTLIAQAGASPFWATLIERVQERACVARENLEVHLVKDWGQDGPFTASLKRDLQAHRINGVIGVGLHESASQALQEMGVPCIGYAGHGHALVETELRAPMREAVARLYAQGGTRFAFWHPCTPGRAQSPRAAYRDSIAHFYEALREVGANTDASVWHGDIEAPHTRQSKREQGVELARRTFAAPRQTWPDALLIGDDMMTTGVLSACDEANVQLGRDLHIATQANRGSLVLEGRSPLALLEYNPAEFVDALFAGVERMMKGEAQPPVARISGVLRSV